MFLGEHATPKHLAVHIKCQYFWYLGATIITTQYQDLSIPSIGDICLSVNFGVEFVVCVVRLPSVREEVPERLNVGP